MTKFILTAAIALTAAVASSSSAQASWFVSRHHHSGPSVAVSYGPSRSVYVIENDRPVRRVVYVDRGRYFRVVSGRRVYVSNRVYTSYPSRYYYADGRRRTVAVYHHH